MSSPRLGLSERLTRMQPSGTAAVFDAVAELRRRGESVLSLAVGEPDVPTPRHIVDATKVALDAGQTRYTQVVGLSGLREAICEDSARRRGVRHDPDQVVVGVGAKHVLFNLAHALLDPGDRVVIPTPCWVSYVDQARLCGAEAVLLPCSPQDGFMPTPEALSASLAQGAKLVVLCVPSNPTGAVMDRKRWLAIAEVLRAHAAWVIVDEIYGQLTYEGFQQASLLEVAPDLADRLIVVDGVSKTYAMTGFRVGWMLGPRPIAGAVGALQSQATTSVATMAQCAAEAALRGDQACVEALRTGLAAKRALLCDGLAQIDGLALPCRPRGAFYAFVDVRGWLGTHAGGRVLASDVDVSQFLLEAVRLAVVPGSAFQGPGFVRLSFASSQADLQEALSRLARARALLG